MDVPNNSRRCYFLSKQLQHHCQYCYRYDIHHYRQPLSSPSPFFFLLQQEFPKLSFMWFRSYTASVCSLVLYLLCPSSNLSRLISPKKLPGSMTDTCFMRPVSASGNRISTLPWLMMYMSRPETICGRRMSMRIRLSRMEMNGNNN